MIQARRAARTLAGGVTVHVSTLRRCEFLSSMGLRARESESDDVKHGLGGPCYIPVFITPQKIHNLFGPRFLVGVSGGQSHRQGLCNHFVVESKANSKVLLQTLERCFQTRTTCFFSFARALSTAVGASVAVTARCIANPDSLRNLFCWNSTNG